MHEMHEALWYRTGEDDRVLCDLCPHGAIWRRDRKDPAGSGKSSRKACYRNYALCSPLALDPIEKKPLYHFSGSTFVNRTVGYIPLSVCELAAGSKDPPLTPLDRRLTRVPGGKKTGAVLELPILIPNPWSGEFVLEKPASAMIRA